MPTMKEALDQQAELTPEEGFNLVGIDTYGDPDEQGPYIVNHYDTREAAEKSKAAREKDDPETTFYIYGSEEEG